jgi:tRNA-Thr(GGU) m(6)t(6)A37 methyltransferase TsaA
MPTYEPIGVVRAPFQEKREAPRQGVVAGATESTLELHPRTGIEDAIADLDGFDRLWVISHMHEAIHFRPKVLPPRSEVRRGVLATRSPHRPNPIGLSSARLVRLEGLSIVVTELDLIDGTPILDLKPYLPYADAFPEAGSGWVERDPIAPWVVAFDDEASGALEWLEARGVELREPIASALALGPKPHAYRRIRKSADGSVLAIKEWRATFRSDGERTLLVTRIASGYRAVELVTLEGGAPAVHREFASIFGLARS